MAKKRMFSLQIVDTDAFLEMPLSAQALYFHLVMRADDEGFVDSPRKIVRLIGVQEDDFKILISKRFILIFESGIIVIKHWLIHNNIRMDRFNKTVYTEEKKQLAIKENMGYTELVKINNKDILKLDTKKKSPEWLQKRNKAMEESELPYSFNYKIKQAFWGKECPVCGVKMKAQEMSKNCTPTIQHNIPISKGGKHELDNISVICHNCNVSMRDKEAIDYNSDEVKEVWKSIGNQSATLVKLSKVKLSKVKGLQADACGNEVNQLMFLFEKINPTINYGHKTNRNALKALLDKFGYDQTQKLIEACIAIHGKPYAPRISTPYQLKEKLGDLKAFYLENEQINNNKGQIYDFTTK